MWTMQSIKNMEVINTYKLSKERCDSVLMLRSVYLFNFTQKTQQRCTSSSCYNYDFGRRSKDLEECLSQLRF